MSKAIIVGAGGFGQEVASFLLEKKQFESVYFIDPDPKLKGTRIGGVEIAGDDSILKDLSSSDVKFAFVALGQPRAREAVAQKLKNLNFEFFNIIHPSAVLARSVRLGSGVIVYPNVTVNTEVRIGNFVLLNSNATVGHHSELGNFVTVNPGVNIAGRVKVNKGAYLGIGCNILQNLNIGENAIVGGGALVKENVLAETTVVGVPSRVVKKK